VLSMRWAWVDQGTGRPIGGPRCGFGVDARQGSPVRAPHQEPMSLLLMDQETKEDGLIRRALSFLFDPN
jgi:hypothetical protein